VRLSARLPVLATVTITGLALTATTAATAGAAAAARGPSAAGTTRLWVAHQFVKRGGFNLKVAASPDGSAVFVAGEVEKLNRRGTNATVTALNSTTGATLWQTQYTASPDSGFSEIAVSPDGSKVFAAAAATPAGGGPFNELIVAFSAATGAILWTAGAGVVNPVDGLAVSPDGSAVYTTGSSGTIAYNAATGAALWTAAGGISVAAAPDGSRVYVADTAPNAKGTANVYLTTAYNAATGAKLWASQFNVPQNTSTAAAVAASPNGTTVFVTGDTRPVSLVRYFTATVAFDAATGARLWARVVKVPSVAYTIAASPDGSTVYVLNSANSPNGGSVYATEAYAAANGVIRWTAHYQGPVTGSLTVPQDLAASPDGTRVYVTGNSLAASGQDQFATVAYDAATGALAWVARYGHVAQNSAGEGVAVSPDSSKVYVTGDTSTYGTTIGYSS
jgi:DNA-binding beta-propeller fold protein YncE